MVGGLAWGHILSGGRINSWVLWLIHWANSCSPSNSPLLRCPSHPRRGAARRQCLPLPGLWKFSVRFLKENALSLTEPPRAQVKRRCGYDPSWPAPLRGAPSPSEGRGGRGGSHISKCLRKVFPGFTAYRAVALPQRCPFGAGAGCWWL